MLDISLCQFILDSIHEGVVVSDMQGKFLYFNPAAEEILGLGLLDSSPDEWAKVYGAYLPDMKTPFPTAEFPLLRGIKGETTKNIEQFIKNEKKQTGVFINISGSPLKNDKNEIIGAVAIFFDITSKKKEEEFLKEKLELENRLNKAFIDREERMKELKMLNQSLQQQLAAKTSV